MEEISGNGENEWSVVRELVLDIPFLKRLRPLTKFIVHIYFLIGYIVKFLTI